MTREMRATSNDRGQAAVTVMVVAAVVFMALSSATLVVGGQMIDRTRAQTAADAAALGALQGGRRVAAALAERHGGELVSVERRPGEHRVTVVVRVGDRTAVAAATDAP